MLETIELPGTGRVTTRVGFGGSGLMGGLSERESLRLLEAAFDAGIRHFDVAPSYGHGAAERCLGKFLRGKREQVTVTTKYGILAPQRSGLVGAARSLLRPVVRHLPAVRRRVAQAAAGMKTKARFSPEEARQSLERSLAELVVERIDLWLLHEATADDLDQADLLPFLQQMQKQGRIGMYGLGAERSRVDAVWQRHREYCRALQFEWSVLDAGASTQETFPGAFCLHHRAVSGAFPVIRQWFTQDASLCRRWSDAVDTDLSQQDVLASLLLQAALTFHPDSVVLFSSRKPAHIQSNLRGLDDAGWRERPRRFCELVAEQQRGPFATGP